MPPPRHVETEKLLGGCQEIGKAERRKKGEKNGGNKMLWQGGGGGGGDGIKERKAYCTMSVSEGGGLVPDRCRFEPGVEHRCFRG